MNSQKGQVAVEYVLLLVVAVVVVTMLVAGVVSRGDNPGVLIGAWQKIISVIAADKADTVQP